MNDFVKIFLSVCLLVGAFLFGRNYGEMNFKQSEEYQALIKIKEEQNFTKNDLENAKTKFQNILDSAETKKSEELLAQILQIFLADLGLRIQNQLAFVKAPAPIILGPTHVPPPAPPQVIAPKPPPKPSPIDIKRVKSYEWILQNSTNASDIKRNLKNVEIKNIDTYLKSARPTKPEELEMLYGSYRGRIMDINNKEYATFSFEVLSQGSDQPPRLNVKIQLFKNAKIILSNIFSTTQVGYKLNDSSGVIIDIDNGNTYFQIYKNSQTQQLAGYYYERLVNGTTNAIGTFILNRVDQF